MTSKERIQAVFAGERPDRYPAYEHFWGGTLEQWREEGYMIGSDPNSFFDFDISNCGNFDLTAQLPEERISEDDTYFVLRDSRGIVAQHHKKDDGHTPHWLDMPIKQLSDWWSYKERLVFNKERIPDYVYDLAKKQRAEGRYVTLFNAEPYEQVWPVFGQVQLFMAMLEEPEIVKDALDTWSDLTVECLDHFVSNGLDFDGCWFYGDMGYRNGTLFGPDVYRDLVMPAHAKIVDYLHGQGKKVILHSCGQIKSFIPMLIEVGFDALQPLEAKCDQDVRELAAEYGRQLVFIGNIDVRALSEDKAAIREEMEPKLKAFDGNWNYIFHSDHSIPQTVSFENYAYALDLARGYLNK